MDAAFNRALIADMRANGGRPTSGPFVGRPVLVLMIPLPSGAVREVPVAYSTDGDDLVVVASNAGRQHDPQWSRQLLAAGDLGVEVLGDRFRARARLAEGTERDRLYAQHAARLPGFARYQQLTSRRIPVILLRRSGPWTSN